MVVDRLLRRLGPAAQRSRDLLRRYATMKTQDLFPAQGPDRPSLTIHGH